MIYLNSLGMNSQTHYPLDIGVFHKYSSKPNDTSFSKFVDEVKNRKANS